MAVALEFEEVTREYQSFSPLWLAPPRENEGPETNPATKWLATICSR